MLSEKVKQAIAALSLEDKRELQTFIMDDLFITTHTDKLGGLLHDAGCVIGVTIPLEGSKTEYVWGRALVANQLHNEGYSFSEIGRMLKKDHATIIHHINIVEGVKKCPHQGWGERFRQYQEFNNKMQTI